jgi:hypothetical protein
MHFMQAGTMTGRFAVSMPTHRPAGSLLNSAGNKTDAWHGKYLPNNMTV